MVLVVSYSAQCHCYSLPTLQYSLEVGDGNNVPSKASDSCPLHRDLNEHDQELLWNASPHALTTGDSRTIQVSFHRSVMDGNYHRASDELDGIQASKHSMFLLLLSQTGVPGGIERNRSNFSHFLPL